MKTKNRYINKKRRQKVAIVVVFALLIPLVSSIAVEGFSSYNYKLPDNGESYSCSTCHTADIINQFGVDFVDNNKIYDETLGSMDSDGDNFTNDEEFNADPVTNPGDAESYPGGNTSGNVTKPDTSAYLGPIEMKGAVSLFYTIIIPLVIGILVILAILETIVVVRERMKKTKPKPKNE